MDLSNDSVLLTEVQLQHQNDNAQHNKGTEETNSNDDNYSIFKPKILAAIDNIKGKKKRADVGSVYNLISRTEPTNINKKSIRDFLAKLIVGKLITKKQTTQGYESYHNLSAELHTPYPPRYSIQTPTKDNPIETSECGIQTELFHNNLYVKINAVNTMLKNRCELFGLAFIDNSHINEEHLSEGGLHLNEIGKCYLANSFINFLNKYIL